MHNTMNQDNIPPTIPDRMTFRTVNRFNPVNFDSIRLLINEIQKRTDNDQDLGPIPGFEKRQDVPFNSNNPTFAQNPTKHISSVKELFVKLQNEVTVLESQHERLKQDARNTQLNPCIDPIMPTSMHPRMMPDNTINDIVSHRINNHF